MNSDETLNESFLQEARAGYDFSMENMFYSQALFYAQAMQVESDYSAETCLLAAKAFYLSGQPERAAEALQPFIIVSDASDGNMNTSAPSRLPDHGVFLYARACFDLERYGEAVSVLYPIPRNSSFRANSAFSLEKIESVVHGSAGLLLLGRSLEKMSDRNGAMECYSRCVDMNPLMFEAFDRLSALSFDNSKVSIAPTRFAKTFFSDQTMGLLKSSRQVSAGGLNIPIPTPAVLTGTPMKSSSASRQTVRGGIPMTPPVERRRRGNSPPSVSKPIMNVPVQNSSLCQYLQTMGAATHALNGHDANVVVDTVSKLPGHHQESCLVKIILGKAFVESARFQEAEKCFSSALKQSPSGVVDYIDVYSSVLWQLKKELELAHLCTHGLRVVADKSKCAKLWVAIGNSFSLQKEPETAMKFINRAIQVDPDYAYAHTLMGHEFCAQDKFDRAKQCYGKAVELDPRNYHAYWGLGQIATRQEEYANAKFNLIKALEINPKSSTVRFSLASVAMALRENELAYQQLSIAVELNPRNGPALCQKGLLEMTVLRKLDLAKETLEKALAVAPNEPIIYVLLGKILSSSGGMRNEAMTCFNAALEYLKGTKDTFGIKQAIEELDMLAVGGLN